MPNKINVDRGVLICIHPASGMNVYMYKDDPGVYLNAFGSEISEQIAKEAGYDVARWGKEHIKKARMATAMKAIEKELVLAEDEPTQKVVEEKAGFKLISIGLGRHQVLDPDDNMLTPTAMPKEQAQLLFEALVPKTPASNVNANAKIKPLSKK